MNVKFEQKYDQTFLNTAKAFYINASVAYTPILSIICAVSAIPQFIINGIRSEQMIPLAAIIICAIISFLLQTARANKLFLHVEPANDNMTCVIDIGEKETTYQLKTELNTIRQYHLTNHEDIKELFVNNRQGIIILDETTILPFGIQTDNKIAKKKNAQFFKTLRKNIPYTMTTTLYRLFSLILIIFIITNLMSIFM